MKKRILIIILLVVGSLVSMSQENIVLNTVDNYVEIDSITNTEQLIMESLSNLYYAGDVLVPSVVVEEKVSKDESLEQYMIIRSIVTSLFFLLAVVFITTKYP